MNIKICISSNKNFYKHSLKELIPSLIVSGVPRTSIYCFVGGHTTYESIPNDYSILMYGVPHNSFDFTGLVSILELDLKNEYWFNMHDTCKVGPLFYQKLLKRSEPLSIMKLTSEGRSMNMGIYSQKFIESNKKDILSYKNIDNDLQKFKKKLIKHEDIFIKKSKSLVSSPRKKSNPKNYYSSGVLRIEEYFEDLDLYKIKSNWKAKDNYEVKI
jgi:hypothetical protein